eukprot:2459477-Rhodomonas_salina.1
MLYQASGRVLRTEGCAAGEEKRVQRGRVCSVGGDGCVCGEGTGVQGERGGVCRGKRGGVCVPGA